MRLAIRPHPNAPRFAGPDAESILQEMAQDLAGGHFTLNEKMRDWLRQASLVNAFFWMKYVCGTGGGPYTKLNEDAHLDLANFLQSDEAMANGSRVAVVMPRGTYKSSVATHGFCSWLIIREPNIRARIVNSIVERAEVFLGIITNTFHVNQLVKFVWPEFFLTNLKSPMGSGKSNSKELIVPNRTVYYPEPTVKAGGASGSSEGDHHDWLFIDDPVGMDELDSLHRANVDMEKKKNWFEVNTDALLTTPEEGRVRLACTFYSPDDPNQVPVKDAKAIYGYRAHWFKPKPNGRWIIYYRKGSEDGKPAFPEIYSKAILEVLAAEKRWFFLTQIQNDIYEAGTVELAKFDVGRGRCFRAKVRFKDGTELEDFILTRDDTANLENTDGIVLLQNCDLVMACDPAATEEGMAAKACRTVVNVWAQDRMGYKYLVWLRAGFVGLRQMFDWIFEGIATFKGAVRCLILETNGYQKILKSPLEEEQLKRKVFFSVVSAPASSGKEARIRSTLGNELAQSRLICCNGTHVQFTEEKDLFPGSRYFMDILDASQMALANLTRPIDEDEIDAYADYERELESSKLLTTGY